MMDPRQVKQSGDERDAFSVNSKRRLIWGRRSDRHRIKTRFSRRTRHAAKIALRFETV